MAGKYEFKGKTGIWRRVANHNVFFPDDGSGPLGIPKPKDGKQKKKEMQKAKKKVDFFNRLHRALKKEDVNGGYGMSLTETNRYLGEVLDSMVLEEGLAIGQTIETPVLRVHRYSGSISVTDLTNAGKRGKMVDDFTLYDLDWIEDPSVKGIVEKFASQLGTMKSYRSALVMAKGLVAAARRMGSSRPNIEEHKQKGVRVRPVGSPEIVINTSYIVGYADGQRFSVKDKGDPMNEPTIMQRGKQSASQFYKWIRKNDKRVNSMNFSDIRNALNKEKIDYHYYCAMD